MYIACGVKANAIFCRLEINFVLDCRIRFDCFTEDETDIDDATVLDCATLDWIDDGDCPTDDEHDTIWLEDITLDCCRG